MPPDGGRCFTSAPGISVSDQGISVSDVIQGKPWISASPTGDSKLSPSGQAPVCLAG